MSSLENLRTTIDKLDRQLLKLLSERGEAAKAIGEIKKLKGEAILVPSREQFIYDQLARLNKGPYNNGAILSIFREIISATRALEAPLKISYLGPQATFTNMAAVKLFGSSAEFVAEKGIANVFAEVERDRSDYGVVPIENSTEGVVNHTLDLFVDSSVKICGEIVLRIDQHLLSRQDDLKKIKVVYSHSQALAQCRRWLAENLPHAKLKEVESTALAAKKAVTEKNSAAIASELAASFYGLRIVKREIQDLVRNYTRFLVVGRHEVKKTGKDKTSILFVAKDKPGILFKILAPLAKAKINLTKIESRPLKKKAWEYMFFVDLDGHHDDPKIARALAQLEDLCSLFKVLGSYPLSRSNHVQ